MKIQIFPNVFFSLNHKMQDIVIEYIRRINIIMQMAISISFRAQDKTVNGNVEFVKETKTRPKSRKHPKANKGSSTQRDNPSTGFVL